MPTSSSRCSGVQATLPFSPLTRILTSSTRSACRCWPSCSASLILLAGNRQSEVDRAHAENAYNHVNEVNSKQDDQLRILREQNAISLHSTSRFARRSPRSSVSAARVHLSG